MIFNILLSQSAYSRPLIGSVNCEVITAPSSGSGVITFYLQVISNKSTAMEAAAVAATKEATVYSLLDNISVLLQ